MSSVGPWPHVGGHLVLDLCNTWSWRLDPARCIDLLGSAQALSDWSRVVFASDARPATEALNEAALTGVKEVRDRTIAVLDAHVEDRPGDDANARFLLNTYSEFLAWATPSSTLPWQIRHSPDDPQPVQHTLAASVIDLLRSEDMRLVRRCAAPGCGWFFIDRTRNHSRRWCDPDGCGNRQRVRRYARRRPRSTSPHPES